MYRNRGFIMRKHLQWVAILSAWAVVGAAHAAGIAGGYTQNFDSLGTSGTALPTDWTAWSITAGANGHSEWTTSINATEVGGGTAQTTLSALLDSAITTSTKSAGAFNLAHAATSTDRTLATSPTGNDGVALQLTLTNNTGDAINALQISYDIDKFYDGTLQSSTTSGLPLGEELPGYQLFFSINGGGWTNVSALNPVNTANGSNPVVAVGIPAASGKTGSVDYAVTSITNSVFNLGTSWAAGQTLSLRWVDDNAVNVSPDQVIGLNNVSILAAPVPEPESLALMLSGLLIVGGMARRQTPARM